MSAPFPPLRPFARGDIWAWTATEAAAFDAYAIETIGVPQAVLLENAGRSAAGVIHRLYGGAAVVGLIGAGNNGGDGLVALRTLHSWGYRVSAVSVSDRDRDDPLLHGWPVEVVSDADLSDEGWRHLFDRADVVVDGLLGTGAKGAPRTRQAKVIDRLNRSGRTVVALDVPSGVHASTGEVSGTAVRADVTIGFGAPKVGALLHPARALVGRHVVVEIGFPPTGPEIHGTRVVTPDWARDYRPSRETDTHKNRVGRVLVVGGQAGMAGAVILTARAAFSAGAGLVRVCTVRENRDAIHAAVPEAMVVDVEDSSALGRAASESDAIAVGPGLGLSETARVLLRSVVASGTVPLLLDADALNLVAEGVVDLAGLSAGRAVLITPHPGEMARLLNGEDKGRTRIEVIAEAVARFRCAVLFKGAPSLVAAPGEPLAIDSQSSSDLAVAGMGDTLSGTCVALLAQGVPTATAASLGLYLSGRAATLAGRGAGLTPSDIVRWLPEALREGGASRTDLDLPFVTYDADPAR
ncbi:MAG: NAD(P)H-hydrate dehydratase [Gemmatimonadetes bacterium]|nr:NAD(P)H-hydrate dehydratase [Gemmatimonadota bacterium]